MAIVSPAIVSITMANQLGRLWPALVLGGMLSTGAAARGEGAEQEDEPSVLHLGQGQG